MKINDAKFHFARTFLSEYWIDQDSFTFESKKGAVFSLIKRAWSATSFSPLSAFSSVIVVSASLLILTFILIFDLNIKRLLDEVGGSNEALLYFKLSSEKSSYQEIQDVLQNEFHVENQRIILKDEALKNFGENLGSHSGILSGLDGNPLPDSLEFQLPLNSMDESTRNTLIENVKNLPSRYSQIEEVVVGAPLAETAQSLREGVQKLSFIVLVFVFGVVGFIVSNVVKLMLYAHREEIEIMQLVGAPRYRVVTPYLISGACLGLLGAVFALVASYFLFNTFLIPLNSHLVFGLSYQAFKFIGFSSISLVLILGLLLGIGGGWFALRKWVD